MSKVIFTSFHPIFSFENNIEKNRGKQFCKSLEASYLWLLYIRNFFPKDYHIVIIDQNSDFDINYLLQKSKENFEILEDDSWNFDKTKFLHVKKFKTKDSKIAGVKRLYFWLYEFCYYNKVDMFFIEQDCFVAKDLSYFIENSDFLTNNIYYKERVCDTYLCNISISRLIEKDNLFPLMDYIKNLKQNDTYIGDRWQDDVICMILCERGMYSLFCYGNVCTLNDDANIHNATNEKFLAFLEKYPIENSYYNMFTNTLKSIL